MPFNHLKLGEKGGSVVTRACGNGSCLGRSALESEQGLNVTEQGLNVAVVQVDDVASIMYLSLPPGTWTPNATAAPARPLGWTPPWKWKRKLWR